MKKKNKMFYSSSDSECDDNFNKPETLFGSRPEDDPLKPPLNSG